MFAGRDKTVSLRVFLDKRVMEVCNGGAGGDVHGGRCWAEDIMSRFAAADGGGDRFERGR
jgi:hypothetical protein